MDRLTHVSITNCVKELDALEKLILSGDFTLDEIASWVSQISWELSNVFNRTRYDSDEFQFRLKKLIISRKTPNPPALKDEDDL